MRVILANSEKSMRGGEYQTCLLAAGLLDRDCQVTLMSPPGADINTEVSPRVILQHVKYELPPLITPLRIRKYVKEWCPDIIHAQTSRAHTHMRLAGGMSSSFPPLVVSRRVAFDISGGLSGMLKYRRGVSRFLAVSEAAASKLLEAGVRKEKIDIVRSGVDVETLAVARPDRALAKSLGLNEDDIVIGTVASFEREKGYPTLIEAARKLTGRYPGIRFVFRGSGSMESEIKKQIEKNSPENRISIVSTDIPLERFLPMLDIFVLPSYREGLSTALVSAVAAGVPSVGSNTGGIPEVLSSGAGMLFEPGNSEELVSSIEELIRNPARREELSARGRENAGEFDIGKTVKRTYEIYREISAKKRMN